MGPDGMLNRRHFMGLGFGSALGLMASRMAFALPDERSPKKPESAAACIILWLQGGPSQLETFDPKPGHPNGGPTRAIKTRTPGLQLPASLPRLAERSKELLIVRSLSSTEGDHARATYFVKTGRKPIAGIRYPAMGAVAATAAQKDVLPPYMRIGGRFYPGQADQGFLPSEYAPFLIERPGMKIPDLAPPASVDKAREERRAGLLEGLDDRFERRAGPQLVTPRRAAMEKARAFRGRPECAAFELEREPAAIKAAYGRNNFGQSCLLARRLIEGGVRCVEVVQPGWDTHSNNFNQTSALGQQLDQAFAALIDDLKVRDLLKSTLIVCMGEFGRTPVINRREGRDHFPRAFGAALAGRNVRAGHVVGATSADGLSVTETPISIPELFASCVTMMSIDPDKEYTVGDRPITVTEAKPRKELMMS